MSDLISRQMLLEYIHGEPVGRLLCDKYNLDGLIKQFPSAQPYTDEEVRRIQELEQAQFEKMYELGYQAGRAAQPERKRGRWISYRCDMYECSECGYIYTELTDRHKCGANYCPNCGEDMRGEQDDESRSNSNAQTDTRARGMGATDKSSGI